MAKNTRMHSEGIRDDGTVEGVVIETFFSPLEYVRYAPGTDGYVRFVSDGPGYHQETRMAATDVVRLARKLVEETPELEEFARLRSEDREDGDG